MAGLIGTIPRNPGPASYFDYPDLVWHAPPELAGTSRQHPVTVVGAGPVGLALALELARQQVPVVVVDDKGRLNDGSRAICLARTAWKVCSSWDLPNVA